jgi:PAS domain S-box-containing protein
MPQTISSMTNKTDLLIAAGEGFEGTQRSRAEQRALSDLGSRLSAAITEREAAEVIVTLADQLFGWDACFLASYSKEDDTIKTILCIDTINGAKTDAARSFESQRPSPWARQIIHCGAQLILRKAPLKTPPETVPFGDQSRPCASLIAAPLRDASKVTGILSLQRYMLNAYTEDDLKLLQALADHCHAAFERIRVEEKLREQVKILEHARDAIVVQDLDNRITYWNRGAEQTYGWSATEAVGRVAHILLQTQFPESLEAAISKLLQDGEWEGELVHVCRDGKRITVASRWALLQDTLGQTRAFLEVNRDITHQKVLQQQAEDALQRSQQHLQALFDNALDAIFLADNEARFVDVNPVTCVLSGYQSAELLKMSIADISVPEMRTRFPRLWQRFLTRGRLNADYTILRKDGTKAEVEFRAVANVLPGLHMATARDVTKRKAAADAFRRIRRNLEKEVRQRTANLISTNLRLEGEIEQRERLQHELLEITERERNRIGRDLHDDLGQQLSGLALMTKGLQVKLLRAGRCEAKEAEKIHALMFRAINHAHDLVHDLASLDLKERDLRTALMNLAAQVRGLFKISCRFLTQGVCPPLEESVKRHLYKIAQEAVTNAIKHGKARHVWIKLGHSNGKLVLSLRNDGIPFSQERLRSDGMGLRIMNYRASTIGGTLSIKVNDRKQTIVSCCIPVSPVRTRKPKTRPDA